MSRPNKQRAVLAEDHLAQRVAAERDARGWTNDGLAKRMSLAGCAMTGSAIFKIEKGEPRRRIVVDELVAFSQVFGLPLNELLLPPEVAVSKELGRLVVEWDQARQAADEAAQTREEAWAALEAYVPTQRLAEPALERVITDWASARFDDDNKDFEIAYRMWKLTSSAHWRDRVKGIFDGMVEGNSNAWVGMSSDV